MSEPVAPMVLATMGAVDVLAGPVRRGAAVAGSRRARASTERRARQGAARALRARASSVSARDASPRRSPSFAEAQRLQSLLASPDPLAIQARGLQAQTLVRLGDCRAARAALATASDAEREYAETRSALAAIHLAERDPRGAIDVLAPVRAGTAPIVRDFSVINALLLDALARDTLGDSKAAEDDVERALDLAEPDALILPFLITPARDLLERHPRHRTAHAALLANILDVLAGSPVRARSGEPRTCTEDLTESEIRVLRYLPSNLSAPEIAAEIFLSTSTVKTHMRHIYEKLGAHKRTEAVDRARELGLLGPSARTRR